MKKDQRGFTAVEVVIVLVVVALVAAAGWYVYRANKKDDKKSTTTAQTTTDAEKKTETPSEEAKTHFVIKEWGVKAEYSGSQKLTYKMTDGNKGVYFSSEELKALSSACGENGSGGMIDRYVGSDQWYPSGDGPTVEESAKTDANFKKIGDYYYRFIHSQSACGNNDAEIEKTMPIQQQVNGLVKDLVPKLIAE